MNDPFDAEIERVTLSYLTGNMTEAELTAWRDSLTSEQRDAVRAYNERRRRNERPRKRRVGRVGVRLCDYE